MKISLLKQHEDNSTKNNQNDIGLNKMNVKEASLPLSSSVKFVTFCKKTAYKKTQDFDESG